MAKNDDYQGEGLNLNTGCSTPLRCVRKVEPRMGQI